MRDRTKWLMDQIKNYANDDLMGRIYADTNDLVDICEWYLDIIANNKTMTEDELEKFLIDLEVGLIDHAQFHLKSLRKGIRRVLSKFPNE